jgi:hypothetical protein
MLANAGHAARTGPRRLCSPSFRVLGSKQRLNARERVRHDLGTTVKVVG